MNDTRALLNRVAEFRKRLDAMPRLHPNAELLDRETPEDPPSTTTQNILAESIRQLAQPREAPAMPLTDRAKRLLMDAHGLVARLRAMADDPMIGSSTEASTDPLAILHRETAGLTEAAVRYASTLPGDSHTQERLCEGLEGMIDAARRRYEQLAARLERKRQDESRIERLSRYLQLLATTEAEVDESPLLALVNELIASESGESLRFLYCEPEEKQGCLGGTEFPPPIRFVAAHSLNCAAVAIRIAAVDRDWRGHLSTIVVAALLHDVGMIDVDSKLLGHGGSIDIARRQTIEAHAERGADWIARRMPKLAEIGEVAASHHERVDGTGYPKGKKIEQVSPLTRFIGAVDVYAAMCAPRPHRSGLDPRAAMTDVLLLADRGKLDRGAAEKLLSLGLYPVGSVVELADGSTAVVVSPRDPRNNLNAAARPVVGVLCSPDGRALTTPRYLDLAEANVGPVIRTLEPIDRLRRLGRSFPEWV